MRRLGVPLEVVPLTNPYWDLVVSHSIAEIARGAREPDMPRNPGKFGAFRSTSRRTGPGSSTASRRALRRPRPRRGNPAESGESGERRERKKTRARSEAGDVRGRADQTYFLAPCPSRSSRRCASPWALPKARLREVARAARLPNAARKDSRGSVSSEGQVQRVRGRAPGRAPRGDRRARAAIAWARRGFWFHTIGQRSRLGLSGGPWYVCGKDVGERGASRGATTPWTRSGTRSGSASSTGSRVHSPRSPAVRARVRTPAPRAERFYARRRTADARADPGGT